MSTHARQHRAHALALRSKMINALFHLPNPGSPLETVIHRLQRTAITALMTDLDVLLLGECPHDPVGWTGEVRDIYPCPDCGCEVAAGLTHAEHQAGCRFGFDLVPVPVGWSE